MSKTFNNYLLDCGEDALLIYNILRSEITLRGYTRFNLAFLYKATSVDIQSNKNRAKYIKQQLQKMQSSALLIYDLPNKNTLVSDFKNDCYAFFNNIEHNISVDEYTINNIIELSKSKKVNAGNIFNVYVYILNHSNTTINIDAMCNQLKLKTFVAKRYMRYLSELNLIDKNLNVSMSSTINFLTVGNTHGAKSFSKKVRDRDGYCVICKSKHRLHAHHLNGRNWDIENVENIDNGVAICEECHKEFHTLNGNGNNTKQQFEEFYKMKTGIDDEDHEQLQLKQTDYKESVE